MQPADDRGESIHQDLRDLFKQAKMPSSPALASRILTLIKDPTSSAGDFGDVIRTDPALSARLLCMANSAAYAQREPVTSCDRAIMVLGLNRIKTISLGFQLVTHLDRLGGAPFDMSKFWQHSLLRACLARAIAQKVVPTRQEEAFLVGLLQDAGVLLLVQILGGGYANLYRSRLSPAAFFAVERKTFPHTHVEAIATMASEWGLPKLIATPLTRHHLRTHPQGEPSELDHLVAISHFVGNLIFAHDLKVDADDESLRQYGVTALGLDEEEWTKVRALAGDEYAGVSILYSDVLPEDTDIADLLGEANHQLALVANEVNERLVDVESERDSIQNEQVRLSSALREYRERAAVDPLTNVLNRGALTDAARRAIKRNSDDGTPVGVFFIDLDNFKSLNDAFGHKVGDNVLKAVAACLSRDLGRRGIVGRYGGEEFVIVVQGVCADETRKITEGIVRSVRGLDRHDLGCPRSVTCSVGGIWSDHVEACTADDLFSSADRLMYKAKRSGRDRYCFEMHESAGHAEDTDDRSPHGKSAHSSTGTPCASEPQLDELLAVATTLNNVKQEPFSGIRKQARQNIVMPCVLHYFPETGTQIHSVNAATRNMSTGGMGLLTSRPMVRCEAVEVAVDKNGAELFLAGLVTFCRQIEGTIHEVGVQFVMHSTTPIISRNPSVALQEHDWVAQAVSAKQEGKLEASPTR